MNVFLSSSTFSHVIFETDNTDLRDFLRPREALFLKVIGQVQEGASLQVMAVTEDD